ncbi:MAG TPA: hypothetical protein VNW68_03005, partial [Candidatus Limnocylindria bacterium]|nr:hypothetical protein [Candidatus Limnocylindria bacterium]
MLARHAPATAPFGRRDAVRLLVAATGLIVALGGILALDALPGPFARNGTVGEVAQIDYRAPRAARFTSDVETSQRQEIARRQVPPQYDYSLQRAQAVAQRQVAAFEQRAAPIDAAFAAVLTEAARAQALRAAVPELSPRSQSTLAGLDRLRWTALRAEAIRALELAQSREVALVGRKALVDACRQAGARLFEERVADLAGLGQLERPNGLCPERRPAQP